jgi:hypothetical protein
MDGEKGLRFTATLRKLALERIQVLGRDGSKIECK